MTEFLSNQNGSADDLRKKAEERLLIPSSCQQSITSEDAQRFLHELQVHQIELEMQNEELRRTEIKLEASRAKYFDLFDLAPAGYLTLNEKGLILEANFTAAALLGTDQNHLVKQPVSRFIIREDQDIYYLHRKQLIQTGERQVCELRMVRQDKTRFWVRLEAVAVQCSESGALLCRCMFSDISKLKETEEKQRQLELQSRIHHKQKLESLGVLAGGIAHDFNNLLAVIFGYSDLAKMELSEDDPVYDAIQNIMAAALIAKELVEQILNFSHQPGEAVYPIDMKPILKESIKMLRASIPTSIEIITKMEISKAIINANPSQLQQIAVNLVTNAMHAIGKKGVIKINLSSVAAETHKELELCDIKSDEYVYLSISDTGHGISPDIINKIFDPYFTTKEKGRGTGLGLSIVHGIVKKLGGMITVTSEVGCGSTFHIYFPFVEQKAASADPVKKDLKRGTERVLLVDDEPYLGQVGKNLLTNIGYQVTATSNPVEALELFVLHPDQYDLVLTDMTMPKLTGDYLAREILSIRPDIPVMIITGYNEGITPEVAQAIGVRRLLTKPLSLEALSVALRTVLDT